MPVNTLEKIVNTIRIAPHGIIPTVTATALGADKFLNFGLYSNSPQILQMVYAGMFGFCTGFVQYSFTGICKYTKFKKFIKQHGICKGHIEVNLKWYCERQAYKAAAYSCDLGKEFDEINRNYQGKKYLTWVPEV